VLIKRYFVACDICGERPQSLLGKYEQTAQAARRDVRRIGWRRIPRGSPEDKSRLQRGMDICKRCQEVVR